VEQISKKTTWFLDSGCSNHICGDKKAFVDLTYEAKHFVKYGNDSHMVWLA